MSELNTNHGVSFLCATHDDLVVSHARQIITLSEGKLQMQVIPSPNEVTRNVDLPLYRGAEHTP